MSVAIIVAPPRKPRLPCPICLKVVDNTRFTFCSNLCQNESRYRSYIERWQRGEETGNKPYEGPGGRNLQVSNFVRRYLFEKYGACCTRCQWSETNPVTGKVPLNVEHLDGDPWNSCEANLTLLCPNCHSLTPTYGSLNKGRGRSSRSSGP